MNKKLILIILIILATSSTAAAGYYFFKTTRFCCAPETEENLNYVKNQQNETDIWKTYKNEEYGFEIKYPKDWNEIPKISINEIFRISNYFEKDIIDTDKPTNQIILSNNTSENCTSSDWKIGFGGIYWKTVCNLYDSSYKITMSAINKENKILEDKILNTFKFIDQQITKDKSLTIEKLKNAEYITIEGGSNEGKITLKNGIAYLSIIGKGGEPISGEGYHIKIESEEKIAFGDLNNDNIKDAAVILVSRFGGTGSFKELAVVINNNGKPHNINSKSLGDRTVINSVKIKDSKIILDIITHGPKDALCCPTLQKTIKLELRGNELIEL